MKLWRKYIKASVILVKIFILTVFFTLLVLFCKKDRMDQYRVYVSESYVIVENRNDSEKFRFKEYVSYSIDCIEGIYLCTKDGTEARNEKEAYLYIDLGKFGGWWADPFNNLDKDKPVANEQIPDGLINELTKYTHLEGGYTVRQLIDDIEESTEEEIKRTAPKVFTEVYDEEAVYQRYFRVDFDNDGMTDIVVYNKLGMGNWGLMEIYFYHQAEKGQYCRTYQMDCYHTAPRFLRYNGKLYFMNLGVFDHNVPESEYDYEYCKLYYFEKGHPQEAVFLMPENLDSEATENGSISNNQEAERKLDITVKKRFVNDFINIPEGH